MLTGNKDVDRKILNKLEDKDLVKACQVNKYADSICNDQVFWMNRVFDRFGYVGGDLLRKYKKDRSWSEYYIQDLRKITPDNAKEYMHNNTSRLDYIIIAVNIGSDIRDESPGVMSYFNGAVNTAAMHGHLDTLKYLVSQGGDISLNHYNTLSMAKMFGHEDVVKYLTSLIESKK